MIKLVFFTCDFSSKREIFIIIIFQVQSVRLAYQDLSLQQKKEEDKLKIIDPKKAEQVERLGMGFNTKS